MIGLEPAIRILAGGFCCLIVASLTALLLRVWYLMVRQKVNGMVKMLFHVLLAGDFFVLNVAAIILAGIWLRDSPTYRLSISTWTLISTLWLQGAIVYALMCITRELYRENARRKTPKGRNR